MCAHLGNCLGLGPGIWARARARAAPPAAPLPRRGRASARAQGPAVVGGLDGHGQAVEVRRQQAAQLGLRLGAPAEELRAAIPLRTHPLAPPDAPLQLGPAQEGVQFGRARLAQLLGAEGPGARIELGLRLPEDGPQPLHVARGDARLRARLERLVDGPTR